MVWSCMPLTLLTWICINKNVNMFIEKALLLIALFTIGLYNPSIPDFGAAIKNCNIDINVVQTCDSKSTATTEDDDINLLISFTLVDDTTSQRFNIYLDDSLLTTLKQKDTYQHFGINADYQSHILKIQNPSDTSCFKIITLDPFNQCSVECTHPDFDALMALYESTNGDQWTNNSGWQEAKEGKNCDPCSGWYGVNCYQNRVSGLELINNNLNGQFQRNLELTQLSYLNISDNKLTGTLPAFSKVNRLTQIYCTNNNLYGPLPKFSELQNLAVFEGAQNNFDGSIPLLHKKIIRFNVANNNLAGNLPNMDSLTSLRYFNINFNNLEGIIPRINHMNNLIEFSVAGNQLSGNLPSLDGLYELKDFYVYANNFIGTIPSLTSNKNLRDFNCGSNQLEGNIPFLNENKHLRSFVCFENNLSGLIPTLDSLINLEEFVCTNNQISGKIPSLENNINLNYFDCSANSISGTIPDLSNLKNLERFNCGYNLLSGQIPKINILPNLIIFSCSNNQLTGTIPDLSKNSKLRAFDCSNNQITDTIQDLNKLINLREILISNNYITGKLPQLHDSITWFYAHNNNFQGCVPPEYCALFNEGKQISTSGNIKLPNYGDLYYYCSNLNSKICNDGDSTTFSDQFIEEECICKGIKSINFTINISKSECLNNNTINTPSMSQDFDDTIKVHIDVSGISKGMMVEGKLILDFGPILIKNITFDSSGFNVKIPADNNIHRIGITINKNTTYLTTRILRPCSSNCPNPDYESLIALYESTNGNNWFQNFGWRDGKNGTNCDPCNGWYGVKCENNRVVEINLRNNNLRGKLPDLTKLSEIKDFTVELNQITGSIPDINTLTNLQSFDVGNNKLSGSLPKIDGLISLEYFNCSKNEIGGILPSIDNLRQLRIIRFENNKLEGSVPDLDQLENLIGFDVSYNLMTGPLPKLSQDSVGFRAISNNLSGCIPDNYCELFEKYGAIEIDNNNLLPSRGELRNYCNKIYGYRSCNDNDSTTYFDQVEESTCICKGTKKQGCNLDIVIDSVKTNAAICYENGTPLDPTDDYKFVYFSKSDWHCEDFTSYEYYIDNGPRYQSNTCQADSFKLPMDNKPHTVVFISSVYCTDTLRFGPLKCQMDCFNPEMKALLALYDSTGGDQWKINAGWKEGKAGTNCDPCTWFGIGCANGKILSINLPSNNLRGQIPHLLENLRSLKSLNLSYNFMTGEIPSFKNFSSLHDYFCNDNLLQGSLPEFNDSLVFFDFSQNNLSGCIPENYCNDYTKFSGLNNPLLPFRGDIQKYCTLQEAITVTCDDRDSSTFNDLILETDCSCKGIPCNGYFTVSDTFIIEENQTVNLDIFQNDKLHQNFDTSWYELLIEVVDDGGKTIVVNSRNLNLSVFVNGFWEDEISLRYILKLKETTNCPNKSYSTITLYNKSFYENELCKNINPVNDIFVVEKGNWTSLNLINNDFIYDKPITSYGDNIEYEIKNLKLSNSNGIQYELLKDIGLNIFIQNDWSDSLFINYDLCLVSPCQNCATSKAALLNNALAELTLTTIISPNNDGMNDFLKFTDRALDDDLELSIYNRWGQKVFESQNYNNLWEATGHPGGIYFYILKYRGIVIKKSLTVVK